MALKQLEVMSQIQNHAYENYRQYEETIVCIDDLGRTFHIDEIKSVKGEVQLILKPRFVRAVSESTLQEAIQAINQSEEQYRKGHHPNAIDLAYVALRDIYILLQKMVNKDADQNAK